VHRKRSVELAVYLADSLAQSLRAAAGLELPTIRSLAESLAAPARDSTGWERVFVRASAHARAPWGARIGRWRAVEAVLPDLMDRVTLRRVAPDVAARDIARQLDRLLSEGRQR
jgi:hypothetical protein